MGPFSEQLQLQWIKRNNVRFTKSICALLSRSIGWSLLCYCLRGRNRCCVLRDVTRDLLFPWYIEHQPLSWCGFKVLPCSKLQMNNPIQDKKFSLIPPSRLNRGRYDHKISWGVILEYRNFHLNPELFGREVLAIRNAVFKAITYLLPQISCFFKPTGRYIGKDWQFANIIPG